MLIEIILSGTKRSATAGVDEKENGVALGVAVQVKISG